MQAQDLTQAAFLFCSPFPNPKLTPGKSHQSSPRLCHNSGQSNHVVAKTVLFECPGICQGWTIAQMSWHLRPEVLLPAIDQSSPEVSKWFQHLLQERHLARLPTTHQDCMQRWKMHQHQLIGSAHRHCYAILLKAKWQLPMFYVQDTRQFCPPQHAGEEDHEDRWHGSDHPLMWQSTYEKKWRYWKTDQWCI